MRTRDRRILILAAILVAAAMGLFGCSRDKASKALEQSYDYTYESDDMTVAGIPAACYPVPAVDTLLTAATPWWAGIKSRVKEIQVRSVYYKVTQNQTPSDGNVEMFVGSSVSEPQNAEHFLDTQNIAANTTYADWTEAVFVGGGKEALEGFINDFETSFALCGAFNPPSADVNLTIKVQVNLKIIYSPI